MAILFIVIHGITVVVGGDANDYLVIRDILFLTPLSAARISKMYSFVLEVNNGD